MLIVGLTGGIASGKSVVADYFKELGAHVLDADSIGHEVAKKRGIPDQMKEEIHSVTAKEMKAKAKAIIASDSDAVIIVSAPLLIESGAHRRVDKLIVVYASEENRIRRLIERDELSRAEALSRIRAQNPLDEKLKFADFVIYNDGSLEKTRKEVREVYSALSQHADPNP